MSMPPKGETPSPERGACLDGDERSAIDAKNSAPRTAARMVCAGPVACGAVWSVVCSTRLKGQSQKNRFRDAIQHVTK
jgi:hypothetical protein